MAGLNDEQRKLILDVLDDLKDCMAEMENVEEFKAHFLEDDCWVEFFEKYNKGEENSAFILTFRICYDMWINNSLVFPFPSDPEWEKKEE